MPARATLRYWHAETTRVTLRLLDRADGFQRRDEPCVTVQADVHSDGRAFLHAAMRRGLAASRREWRAAAELLHEQHGVTLVEAERGGETVVLWRAKQPR